MNGKKDNPSVSIIIPCRNEEKYIGMCLDSILDDDYQDNVVEVLVVDGMSDDKTKEIVKNYAERHPVVSLIDNPGKIVPSALNIGIRKSRGDIIVRMDAHNIYGKGYVEKCVRYLQEYNADNVGGIWITLPGGDTLVSEAIAFALSHPFGVGNASYRIGSKGAKYVDTVPFGCYRREVFDKIGFFDEDLVRNQDDELNHRLIRSGGKILLAPDIVSYYHSRDSLLKLWKMFYQYGYFKPLAAVKAGGATTWRQFVPAAFVLSLLVTLAGSVVFRASFNLFLAIISAYIIVNLVVSLLSARKKGMRLFLILPLTFAILHFSYGIGYIKGIWDFIIMKRHKFNKREVPLTR